MTSEYEHEPVPGLPARLPAGERILWQGSPDWRSLARRAFHIRKVAVYFGLLMVWRLTDMATAGESLAAALIGALWLMPAAAVAIGLLSLLAWLHARGAIYTVTNRRVVMRYGVAVPVALNIPFKQIASADIALLGQGEGQTGGDIALTLTGKTRLAYLHLWPHARPWHMSRAKPTLRCLPDAAEAGRVLGRALAEHAGTSPLPSPRVAVATTAAPPLGAVTA